MDMTMDMNMTTSSGSSTTLMPASDMAMTFFTSLTTPLFTTTWTPNTKGTYSLTCIFLIVLATTHRLLGALRSVLAATAWNHSSDAARAEVSAGGGKSLHEGTDEDGLPVLMLRRRPQGPEGVWRGLRTYIAGRPFRVASETARAVMDVGLSAIGYLLMLAVMTCNVGYFLSVLAGIFIGSFLVGRF